MTSTGNNMSVNELYEGDLVTFGSLMITVIEGSGDVITNGSVSGVYLVRVAYCGEARRGLIMIELDSTWLLGSVRSVVSRGDGNLVIKRVR